MIVAPSILSADFSKLLEEVKEVRELGAKFLHIDVMDGHFVPNISLGPVVYKDLKGKVDIIFDVHLMITDPLKYAKDFVVAGADYITFHYEVVENAIFVIEEIKKLGVKVGISLKPDTAVEVLNNILPYVDLVLIMSVEPGFGGQKFMTISLDKIAYLAAQKQKNDYHYLIQVDGGINKETALLAKRAGCEVVVAGTYIFHSANRQAAIISLLAL
ncbi:MAG TPA: ribulose-phosphate 3-epimerase [Bacilli bacterium]|nr:ribulose-phosphate 3-epimerase [Bacilli bacterium]